MRGRIEIGKSKFNEGQLLVEVILAVAVAIIALSALVSLATLAIRFSRSSLERSMAEKLALGGVEAVRITKDKSSGGYSSFGSSDNYYMVTSSGLQICSGSTCNGSICANRFNAIDSGNNTIFCRKIKVSSDTVISGLHYRNVFVEVRWKEGVGDRVSYISTRIFE